jgi:hypothetical protein
MANDFGLTFAPTGGDKSKNTEPNAPVQEAIRTLSLRIPQVAGAKALTPGPLMNSMGGGGLANPMGINLERLLQMLFGQGQPASPQGARLQPGTSGFGAGQTSQPGTMPIGPRMPQIQESIPTPAPQATKPNPWVQFGEAGAESTPLTQSQPQSQATQSAMDKFSDPYRNDPRY